MKTKTTRLRILDAALARFGHYGFNKTTMAEIAKDCEMSAANIYRHFDGKNEILADLALQLFKDQESELSKISTRNFATCSDKLLSFFEEALLLTHQYVTEQVKMKEMVDYICLERFDLVDSHCEVKRRLIQDILLEGKSKGEFTIPDLEQTTRACSDATVMFHTPIFMEMYSLAELQSSCRGVVQLLLTGLTCTTQETP